MDRPLMFSPPMVRALLAGQKTQTRREPQSLLRVRVLAPVRSDGPPGLNAGLVARPAVYQARLNPHGAVSVEARAGQWLGLRPSEFEWLTPCAVGDTYWVRESFQVQDWAGGRATLRYLADDAARVVDVPAVDWLRTRDRWQGRAEGRGGVGDASGALVMPPGVPPLPGTSGRYLPRWAARLSLTVTAVRLERLQQVSEDDAWAEGVTPAEVRDAHGSAPGAYRVVWEGINGPGSWDKNPWVWVRTFTVDRL